jgi:FkbM family methyltransferase
VWQTAGFCKRLPAYWKLDRSESLRLRRDVDGLPLFITPEVFVQIPESVSAYTNWRDHGIEDPDSSAEASAFLDLARGRSALIDIGAQTGFMSALFAKSRVGPTRILSVEPDRQVHQILARARELNLRPELEWDVWHEAVSNVDGTLIMPISNTVRERMLGRSELGKPIEVPSRSFGELIRRVGWNPDIVKIDVESFEHEILSSAMSVLAETKPALQLEVHWEMLAKRGRSADDFLVPLAELGYRGTATKYRRLDNWRRAARSEPVSRLSLQIS